MRLVQGEQFGEPDRAEEGQAGGQSVPARPLTPPLKWYGGKRYLAKQVVARCHGTATTWSHSAGVVACYWPATLPTAASGWPTPPASGACPRWPTTCTPTWSASTACSAAKRTSP